MTSEDTGGGATLSRGERTVEIVSLVFGSLLCLVSIFFATQLAITFGFTLFNEQGLAIILAFSLALIFIRVPALRGTPRTTIPWYDFIAAAAGFLMGAWLSLRYPILIDEAFYRRPEIFTIGIVLIPLSIEALRRTAGWSFTSIVIVFLLYALFGDLIPGKLQARTKDVYQLVAYLAVDPVAMLGIPMTIICTIVVMFIFLGQLLLKSGASEWFTDIASALTGRRRGGAAKISVVGSSLFGMISGSAVSNVATTGVITIPLMRQSGYERKVAGAIEAVSSTGGQIMPPIMGAAAFLMAEFLQISYAEVVIAAIIPAVLYYFAVFVYADLEAARKNIAPLPADQIPTLTQAMKDGWFFLVPIGVLIYTLFWLNRTPEQSALWAAGTVVLVNWVFGYKGKRVAPIDILYAVRDTGLVVVDVVVVGAMAGVIIGIIDVTGVGFGLTYILVQLGEQSLLLLLALTAVVCIVLGMGMPTTAIYLLVATLAVAPLIKLGINPLAAHLFVFYFGLVSLITPPVAIAAFVAANLAGSQPMETAVQAIRLGWTALVVPVMFVLSPNLIMQGQPLNIAIAVVTAFAGVWIATAGILGYLFRPMHGIVRAACIAAGIGLMVPNQAFEGAVYVELIGLVLGVAVIGSELITTRRLKAA